MFEVFVTTDKNLKYQPNFADRRIAMVVLMTTSWPRIQLRLRYFVEAVDQANPGSYCEVLVPGSA